MVFDWYRWCANCWANGTITESQLQTAVSMGRITQEQYDTIVGEPYGVNGLSQ